MKSPTSLLVIDNDPRQVLLIREWLADRNWNAVVEGVTTVAAARQLLWRLPLSAAQPDLLIIDHRLDQSETAVSLMARVRAGCSHRIPPFVILSAMKLSEPELRACCDIGALRVFEKPTTGIGFVRFLSRLRALLEGNGSISSGGSWIGEAADARRETPPT